MRGRYYGSCCTGSAWPLAESCSSPPHTQKGGPKIVLRWLPGRTGIHVLWPIRGYVSWLRGVFAPGVAAQTIPAAPVQNGGAGFQTGFSNGGNGFQNGAQTNGFQTGFPNGDNGF